MNSALKHISALRDHLGSRMQDQYGLTDTEIARWEAQNHLLAEAIASALPRLRELEEEFPELLTKGEEELLSVVSQGYLNFYAQETCSPYIPLTAQGPWIVTYGGAVIYDTGGYGMLGHGHNPEPVRAAMSQPQVMANIMTPSFAQYRLREKLLQKIGHRHSSRQCPFN
ncbi:lysine 6-aminotransferase, partial [bacterium]|nr:lysine 6-aminotransferase [bacterium]